MPVLFIVFGIRFYFYANDHEPIHVHVTNANGSAIIQVLPNVALRENQGMKPKDIKVALQIAEENKAIIIEKWREFFAK